MNLFYIYPPGGELCLTLGMGMGGDNFLKKQFQKQYISKYILYYLIYFVYLYICILFIIYINFTFYIVDCLFRCLPFNWLTNLLIEKGLVTSMSLHQESPLPRVTRTREGFPSLTPPTPPPRLETRAPGLGCKEMLLPTLSLSIN